MKTKTKTKPSRVRFLSIGLTESELPALRLACERARGECPSMTDAAVLRAALRRGLRATLADPGTAGAVQPLTG